MADDGIHRPLSDAPFFDLGRDSLPDIIDLLGFYVHEQADPTGFQRYAYRLFSELDLKTLRGLYDAQRISLERDRRRNAYTITYDRAFVTPAEELVLLQAETIVNRLVRLEDRLDGADPSEEVCSFLDLHAFQQVTGVVSRIFKNAETAVGFSGGMGSVRSAPGGEWDVRTRIASACDAFSPITRLDQRFSCNAAEGLVAMEFVAPSQLSMPHSLYDEGFGRWRAVDESERVQLAHEYSCRIALVLAAEAFSAGLPVKRCSVEALDPVHGRTLFTLEFERSHFLQVYTSLARTLTRQPLTGLSCSRALEFERGANVLPEDCAKDRRWIKLSDDDRPLPESLRNLLMADTMRELDVMEPDTSPSMLRFERLYTLIWIDPGRAVGELEQFVAELEAGCAATELEDPGRIQVQHCDSQMERVLLPLTKPDRSVRIRRAPDALFYAQCELARLYMGMGEYELALTEAQRLVDLAPASSEVYFILVNALARLELYEDEVEACKNGMRVAYSRSSTAYFYYRAAFAYWNLGEYETALACYAMVPAGEQISVPAQEEMGTLLKRMGRASPPSPLEAEGELERAGVPMPLTDEVFNQIGDAAVLLCDNGFFWLAQACVEYLQSVTESPQLEMVVKSLRPRP